MKPEEFPRYRDYFIVDYANEMATNYGYPLEESRAIAQKELQDDLPQTVSTPEHYLFCIEETCDATTATTGHRIIGYLWYQHAANEGSVFILDYVLFEEFRGMGHGKAALIALEVKLRQSGVKEIKLRVAFDNVRAFHLYQKLGFTITGYNMIKRLGE